MRIARDYSKALSISELELKVTLLAVKDGRPEGKVRQTEALELISELLKLSSLRGRPRKDTEEEKIDVAA